MTGQLVSLGELVRAHYGKALKDSDRRGGGQHDVYGSSGIIGRHDQCLVPYPTVVIGRKGSVGSVTFAPNGGWPIDTAFFIEMREPGRADLRYLYWALSNARLDRRAITTSIPGLNRDELYRAKIRLPALSEQHRIAAMLDKADDVRRKQRDGLSLVNQLPDSAFLEMFGDPVKNDRNWTLHSASHAIASLEAGSSVGGDSRAREENEWAVLKISAVTSGTYRPDECKVVDTLPDRVVVPAKGDLLFSRANTRELVAATCLVDQTEKRLFLPDKLWRITPNPELADAVYLRYLLSHGQFRQKLTAQATGTSGSMLNVSQEKLLRMVFPLPPLGLQRRFAALVWKAIETRKKMKDAAGQADLLLESLTQDALTGAR